MTGCPQAGYPVVIWKRLGRVPEDRECRKKGMSCFPGAASREGVQ